MHSLLVVLQAFTQFMKLDRKPPVTVLLVLVNVLAFFRPGELVEFVPSVAEVCLNPYLCLKVSPAPVISCGLPLSDNLQWPICPSGALPVVKRRI